jgi:hypothetical protein
MKKSELRQIIKEELKKSINEGVYGPQYFDRMEGLANINNLNMFKRSLRELLADWMEEGFEREDITEYVSYLVNEM